MNDVAQELRKKSRQNKHEPRGLPPTEEKKEHAAQRPGRPKRRKNRLVVKQRTRQPTNGANVTPRPKASRSGSASAAQNKATVCGKSTVHNPHQKSQADANKRSHLRRGRRKRKDRQITTYCCQEKPAGRRPTTKPPDHLPKVRDSRQNLTSPVKVRPSLGRGGAAGKSWVQSPRRQSRKPEPETQADKDGDGTSVEQKTPQRERARQETRNYKPDPETPEKEHRKTPKKPTGRASQENKNPNLATGRPKGTNKTHNSVKEMHEEGKWWKRVVEERQSTLEKMDGERQHWCTPSEPKQTPTAHAQDTNKK
ncbi:proteoglycan 4-like [Procambarus clarkii]|uniref:proteoglycan 4-like n=1 Tax=Procambarus clarkii TaxID=6728 RepID=UPI00374266D3